MSQVWPVWQSLLVRHWTHVPLLQMGVAPEHAGVHAAAQLFSQTDTPRVFVTQLPPLGQTPSSQRCWHSLLWQALPSPHSQSLPHEPQFGAASTHWLLPGLQASPLGQPAVTQPSQRKEAGVQLPVWQIQPVSQSSPVVHGGRHALPVGSGAHFQPSPHSAALAQVSQPSAVGPVTGSHCFVVVLHCSPLSQPLTVQSV